MDKRSCAFSISGLAIVIAIACGGCANQGYSVIASTATTIGVGISQQPASGGLDATLGYKRAEFALVPTNRNSGDDAGQNAGGAKDSGDVVMELRYTGIFSTGSDSGIYQRLAVGKTAVKNPSAAILFAKGPDGKVDPETRKALAAVMKVPVVDADVSAAKVPLSSKYLDYKNREDAANIQKFDAAAQGCGFLDFDDFLVDANVDLEQVSAIRKKLETDGIVFDK